METGNLVCSDERNYGSGCPSKHCGPINGFEPGLVKRLVIALVANQIINNQNGTHRRDKSIQNVQPAHEVVVQPYGSKRSNGSIEQNKITLGQFGDISQPQAGCIERIVICGPDIQT